MARGGARPGAGRPKGSVSKLSQEVAAEAVKAGITPLDYMLAVMRDKNASQARRDEMAKAVAPYVHPRLSSVESKNEHVHRYVARVPTKQATVDAWQQEHSPEKERTLQ